MQRIAPGAEEAIVAALAQHGFVWDATLTRQSTRTALYDAALERLHARGLVYPCACTRRELEAAPLRDGERIYPGTCRSGIPAAHAQRAQRSLRVRVPAAPIAFVDRAQGPQSQALQRDVGDFVVKRADGWTAYQLAVVVDDDAQHVTHVVRGADLLSSTPRQIFLQHALDLATPTYLHVPVAIDRHGHKLSKQTEAVPLGGDPVRALLAAWSFLDQPPPAGAPRTPAEFWTFAARAWMPARIPPVSMLPAPP